MPRRGVEVWLYSFFSRRREIGVCVQRHTPAALPWDKRRAIYCVRGWVGPGPVWTGAENLAFTDIRSSDRPAHNESLYRLR